MMKFNRRDINETELKQRALTEFTLAESNESTRSDRRSPKKRLADFEYGHVSELYLIQECGFTDNPEPYKDLFDRKGNPIEVKTTGNAKWIEGGQWPLMETCRKFKLESWREYPDYIYTFIGNRTTGDYEFEGLYKWVEASKTFVRSKDEWEK